MEFNTEKNLKKLQTNKYLAIAILIFGLFKILTFKWPYQFTTSTYLGLAQAILFPIVGLILLIISLKKIKLINGDFIKFENNLFHIKTRGVEKKINNAREISKINIKLDSITIEYFDSPSTKIYLEDYIEMKDRKEIKENFERLKSEILI